VVGTDPHGFDGDKDGIGCEVPPATAITPFQAQQQQQQQQEPQQQQKNQTQNRTPTTTTTNANAITATTKTDGLLTTSINGTRFTTNQTILVNGTLGGGEGAGAGGGTLFIELRDPQNETLFYDSANMTTGSSFDTPFSYSLIAGDLEKGIGSASSRTVFKPMNETGDNYTMTVGYDTTNSPPTTTSEVQFVFAYDGDDVGAAAAPPSPPPAVEATTMPPTPEPEPEPEQPESQLQEQLEEQDDELEELQEDLEDLADEVNDDDDDNADDNENNDANDNSDDNSAGVTINGQAMTLRDSARSFVIRFAQLLDEEDYYCFNNQIDRNRISNILTNILEDDNNIYDDETITGNRVNSVLDRITEDCLDEDE
jgi:hypothetical protein